MANFAGGGGGVGSPGRAKALARHAKDLGNPRKAHLAIAKLGKMNLTPAEHMYVRSKVNEHQKIGGYAGIAQQHGAKMSGGGGINAFGHALEGAAKDVYEISPFSKDSYKQARGNKAAMARESKASSAVAEGLTGYQEIQHIRHNPIGGGLAIAGLIPGVGKLGKVAEALRAGRSEEEAAAHVAEATAEAKAMGHGDVTRAPHEPPRVKTGGTSTSTGGELGKQFREAMSGRPDTSKMGRYEAIGAKTDAMAPSRARAQQAELQSAERAKRAGMASEAMKVGGQKGYHEALKQLKGELPKVSFKNFTHLDQQTADAMFTHIQQHEGLRAYDKMTAMRGLKKALSGVVPAQHEQKMLERVFGKDMVQQIRGSIPFWKKAKIAALETLNVPRALMASFDLSAPFRQGLMAGVSHPVLFSKNLGSMLRSFKNEHVFQGVMNGIYDHPLFPLARKAKLAITDIGVDPHAGADLTQREEQFMSNYAERLPGIGHVVRASDRAYVGFLNKTRMDLFVHLTQAAAQAGHDLHDQKVVEDIAKFVNSATGRGDLGALQKHAVTLNTLLFSPRLLASRLNFLNPVYYARLSPFARAEAFRAARNLVLTMATVLGAAKAAGAHVNMDPTNADFAKIKIGNTRIDMAGGFQQPVRLMAQLIEGKITSSTTGKTIHLGPQGVGHLSRKDIAQRFIEGKLAPVPSVINDLLQGTTFAGQPLKPGSEVGSHLTPLALQDLYSIAATGPPWNPHLAKGPGQGLGMAAALALPDLFGIGVQNYSAKKKKAKARHSSGSYGSGGGYGSGSGYGSGGGYGSSGGYGG